MGHDLFRSEPFVVYRIPSLLILDKPTASPLHPTSSIPFTILAFAEQRINTESDNGDVNVVVRRSLDAMNWGPSQTICDFGREVCGNPTAVQSENGRVHVLLTRN